mmetsp:Transcript_28498/g.39668  ORF Transcript_28498/g.39668 Transcript_28498/m.39668 type:complete len:800 (-) Transcript_28498:394-2793(-)|eukprot:CAMPEP_0184487808 /NCGR_PEP_ID=MMETSP0113_2-20130426/10344_1 /TAXON_ID=91329 /ORGANISM="Norrisiella sphaerica, Strain BC52" /LENGTH=799 /DNA_ID=CAMNT_0026870217 /DNA_START=42 /DNA_END=2441 /DNA_ORIENTATION=+
MLTFAAILFILGAIVLAGLFTVVYTLDISSVKLDSVTASDEVEMKLIQGKPEIPALLKRNYRLIFDGANAFLFQEYKYMAAFIVIFAAILIVVLGTGHSWASGIFSATSFIAGSLTSIASGYIGMSIAVFSNARTTIRCVDSIGAGFNTAFKAGSVMGFALVACSILVLFLIVQLFSLYFKDAYTNKTSEYDTRMMYEAIAGYGLGGSSIAMFGRVGGGIYTKAADVGADLAGKVEAGWDEDDPRNPAVIADNVGDNVGDIAGMGADLFGSLAESSCAAMVIASQSKVLQAEWAYMAFPMILMSAGIIVCFLTTFLATHINPVTNPQSVEPVLMTQLVVSTILMTPASWLVCYCFLPAEFDVPEKEGIKYWAVFICVASGLWSGLLIGKLTEYYTSNAYQPVRDVALSCAQGGAAPNIIYGLALGYKSCVYPVMLLALNIFISYYLAHMFGVAVSALGVLSTLAIGLTIDAYGPITDNAGGIAEMSGFPEFVRTRTDMLDAAGNTTAAIGKGFAISSAAMVSLALFGAFVDTVGLKSVDLLEPLQFAGLLVGAMIPYWFSAMTMKSVGMAANAMVEEVRRQVKELRGGTLNEEDQNGKNDDWTVFKDDLAEAQYEAECWGNKVKELQQEQKDADNGDVPETPPEKYAACIKIATDASLKEMIPPGCLVIFTPIIVGFLFGVQALAGLLAGSLVSSVQMAISASNSGGAWDNAKKYISGGHLYIDVDGQMKQIVKKTKIYHEVHNASVIGDTVGDPLKDTSGPALNIVMKLMAIISLVFAPSFPSISHGGFIQQALEKLV